MLLLFAVTTWGQIVEGQMYRLKENNQNLYLTIRGYNGNGEASAYGTVPFLEKATANKDQVWYFESTETEGQYNVRSKSGYYIVHGSWNVNAYNTADATKGVVELVDNGNETYKLKNINNGKWYKSQVPGWGENVLHPFCDAAEDAACIWTLEVVDESEFTSAIEVTYNFIYNGETIYTQISSVAEGAEFPAITQAFPFGVTATKPTGTVNSENARKDITLEINLPFEFASTYDEIETNENWYYLIFHANNQNKLYYDGTTNVLDATKTTIDKSDKDAYSWAFIGDPFNGFKIVNRKAGSELALNAASNGAIVSNGDDNNFKLTASSHGTNGFFIQCTTGNNTQRFNKQGGKVVYWSGADAGSTFMVEARAMGPVADLEDLIIDANTKLTEINANIGTEIGEYAQETADALSAAVAKAEGIGEAATADDVAELLTVINASRKILPIVGKYYQLQSSLTGFAETKAVYANGNAPGWKTLDSEDRAFYWEAVETGNGIALKNANNGKFILGNTNQSGAWSLVDEAAGAEIDVKIFTKDENEKGYEYGIIITGWQMHANGHGNGSGTANNIVSWNSNNANSASSWFIIEAEVPAPPIQEDITFDWAQANDLAGTIWGTALEVADYPATAVNTGAGANEVYKYEVALEATGARTITALYQYTGGACGLNILGFDIIDANGNVIAADYHSGFTGGQPRNNEYTVNIAEAGTYTARTFVWHNSSDRLYNSAGTATISFEEAETSTFTHDVTFAAEYATLYLGYNATIPAGVEAYYITGEKKEGFDNVLMLTQVEGGAIPACTAVILKKTGEDATYTFNYSESATAISTNLLKGSIADRYVAADAYVLGLNNNTVGLYKATLNQLEGTAFLNNANKAYMIYNEDGNNIASYNLSFDWGGTTGIENIEDAVEENATKAIYDITGRQIKAITVPGIYIINGKKTFVK